jgi:hypothetical protein
MFRVLISSCVGFLAATLWISASVAGDMQPALAPDPSASLPETGQCFAATNDTFDPFDASGCGLGATRTLACARAMADANAACANSVCSQCQSLEACDCACMLDDLACICNVFGMACEEPPIQEEMGPRDTEGR